MVSSLTASRVTSRCIVGFQATDRLACEESCFGHISIGLFLAAVLGIDKCFLRRISKAKVLLRENGSDLDH